MKGDLATMVRSAEPWRNIKSATCVYEQSLGALGVLQGSSWQRQSREKAAYGYYGRYYFFLGYDQLVSGSRAFLR